MENNRANNLHNNPDQTQTPNSEVTSDSEDFDSFGAVRELGAKVLTSVNLDSRHKNIITPDTTIDDIEGNLAGYLQNDLDLSSNMLTYILKQKQQTNQQELDTIFSQLDLKLDKIVEIMERIRNLEVLETENYIFMLPKDKWNEGKIKLPNPDNDPNNPEYIAPMDLTAILKKPVYYDWKYETDGRDNGDPSLVYDESWVGKEIEHFPWSKELINEANEKLLKPNGFHIPEKDEWKDIYNNIKTQLAIEQNADPDDIDDSEISIVLRERLNLANFGRVRGGEWENVSGRSFFWSVSEYSAEDAFFMCRDSYGLDPNGYGYRDFARSVRCASYTESDISKGDPSALSRETSTAAEEILEEDLGDSYESTEFFPFKIGERIPGFKDAYGEPTSISSIISFSDDNAMAGGWKGALYNMIKGPDGRWQVGERIPGFKDVNGKPTNIWSLTLLTNDSVMAGGMGGALYNMTKDSNGKWQVGELISGFKDAYGYVANIDSIASLSDSSVMAGGRDGALYNITKGPDGKWQVGELISGFEDVNGNPAFVFSLTPLPDGSVMVGGGRGALYNMTKGPDGKWHVGELITGFEDVNLDPTDILSITPLPDDSVMVGGGNGALYHMTKDQYGKWRVGELIPGFYNMHGYPDDISFITPLPDDSVMVGGGGGALYNMTKGPDGKWQVGELIPGFENVDGDPVDIDSLTLLPDGSVMAGGRDGALYNITKGPDGKWQVGERIPGFEDVDGYTSSIYSFAPLQDGRVMVGGFGGALYDISRQ